MSFTRLVLPVAALAIVLAAASEARAQQCDAKVLCPKGFVCQIEPAPLPLPPPVMTDPAPAPQPASTACPPDAKCAALVAPPTPPSGWCAPAPCAQDSECGAGMVCHSETIKQCTGGTAPSIACAPDNTMCVLPKPAPEMCTESTVSFCAYKWQLPCNTDVDCGAGFNCTPVTTGMCSGSAGTGVATPSTGGGTAPSMGAAAPADFAAPLPPDTCTTTTSFPGYCQPKATTCTADAECPDAWTCVSLPTRDPSTPVMGGGTTTNTGTTAPAPAPAADPIAPPPPATSTKICQSPIGSFGGTAGVGTDTKGSSTGSPSPTTPPTAGGGQTTGQPETSSTNAGGCAVGGGAGGSMLGLGFALLGILIARRRR